MGYTQLYWN